MELNSEVITTPVRAAATVVMLRDGAAGLEVFLIKRHGLSDVLGGAYVFPGGKVDASDATLSVPQHLDQSATALHAALGEPELDAAGAASMYVAALREAFEESGVLYAQGLTTAQAEQSSALLRQGVAFNEVLAHLALRLDTRSLLPWVRWITPKMPSVSKKRFDTRFFIAAVPNGQVASHDHHEATQSVWLAPHIALAHYWAGEIALAPPQIMSLAHLARHLTVASVLTEAASRLPPVIQPEPLEVAGERVICYPGDPQHSLAQRTLPGPTRLHYRNQRFEPEGGLAALLAPG